jgi:molecular chaperone GrpE (heat shock protein)
MTDWGAYIEDRIYDLLNVLDRIAAALERIAKASEEQSEVSETSE